MKQFIFAAFILSVNAIFGVVCIYAAASVTSWLEYDIFHIDMTPTSLWPLAFIPLFIVLSCGTFCVGFYGVKYAACVTCKYMRKYLRSALKF